MESRIYLQIQQMSLFRLITFGAECLPKNQALQYVPEIAVIEKYFHRNSVDLLRKEMQAYNRILHRGIRMGLSPVRNVNPPLFSSLDQFIVCVHAAALAEALNAFSTFADRVAPCIDRDPSALMWPAGGPVLITRDRWLQLCRGVRCLIRLLDINSSPSFHSPDAELLSCAVARARARFGPFAGQRWRRIADPVRVRAASRALRLSIAASTAVAVSRAAAMTSGSNRGDKSHQL